MQRTVPGRLAWEGFLVIIGVSVVGILAGGVSAGFVIDRYQAHNVLSLLAAGVGAAAVGLGQTAGRLSGNRRADWLIPALALYCAVIVPGTALLPDRAEDVSSPRPGMLVAYIGVMGLLLAAIRPPARSGSRVGWLWAAGTALVALVLSASAAVFPGGVTAMVSPLPVSVIVLVGWCSVSTAVVVAGHLTSSAPLWRVGFGFGVIATAHLWRVVRPQPVTDPSLVFATLRLLGAVVVLLGMAQLLRRALKTILSERFYYQEEIRVANLHAEQLVRAAAEREHELRNGLSGLSSMTQLLGTVEPDERPRHVRSAVRNEFDRLHDMLDHGGRLPAVGLYDAAQVMRELVALWRVAGIHIEFVVSPSLMVIGRASTLAQVLTNLFTNCSRHAPGANVQVVAQRIGSVVTVQVRDDGPGRPSTASSCSGGGATVEQGLGLRISQRLLEREGGQLWLPQHELDRPGFTAVVELSTVAMSSSSPAPVYTEPPSIPSSSAVR